jgi:hypothetical protein
MSDWIVNPNTGRLIKKGSKTHKILLNAGVLQQEEKEITSLSENESDWSTEEEKKEEEPEENDSDVVEPAINIEDMSDGEIDKLYEHVMKFKK